MNTNAVFPEEVNRKKHQQRTAENRTRRCLICHTKSRARTDRFAALLSRESVGYNLTDVAQRGEMGR